MRIINSSAAMADALDSLTDTTLKRVLQQRTTELSDYGTDLGELACFVIIEPGDTLKEIEAELNLPIATDESRYTDRDFMAEWIMDHGGLFEAVLIMTDDGYGHVLLVPDADEIDPALLTLCRAHATQPDGPPTG